MIDKHINKTISFFYLTVGLLPIVWMILVLINYLLTANELGQLPKYGINLGQESFPIPYSGTLNMILMMSTFWGVLVVPCVIAVHLLLGQVIKSIPKLTWLQASVSYFGFGLYLILWNYEPFPKMMTWYID